MRILVTGASGFIGTNLVSRLLDDDHEVVAVDRRTWPIELLENRSRLRFIELDIEDRTASASLLRETTPETVIALAEGPGPAKVAVERSAGSLGALLDAAEEAGVRRVCFASSIAVYMGLEGPFSEDMPLPVGSLISVGAIKKVGEQVAAWHNKHTQVRTVSLRLANIYGPRYHSMMNSPSRLLFAALGREVPDNLPSLPPAFYRMVADYCHIDDCCNAISKVVQAEELEHDCYNIGGGSGVTEDHIHRAVEQACGRNLAEPVHQTSSNYLDITRIREELGYEPAYDLVRGIAAYREWLLSNEI